jgi:phosphatidate cytidylyltransferase
MTSNLVVRLLTALVGAPLILALLYFGPPVGFFALVLVVALIGAWEFFSMTHPGDLPAKLVGLALSAAAACALFFGGHRIMLTVLIAIPLLGPLVTLWRLGEISTAALRAAAMSFGPLFVAIPLTLLAVLRRDEGPGYVVIAIMFAWFADTGGYFAGRFLGKHKLYEAVSPKKTVEGAVGGLAGAVFGAVLASLWFLPALPLSHSIPLALVAGALGQAGDLGESLIKRSMGVKDSGAIVPGHGGILDRVDALIYTASAVYLYTLWIAT